MQYIPQNNYNCPLFTENRSDQKKLMCNAIPAITWRAGVSATGREPTVYRTACAGRTALLLTVSAKPPLVVSVVVCGGGTPEPRPVLHNTLLVALSIEYEGEHTGVTFLGFWEEQHLHNPGRHQAAAALCLLRRADLPRKALLRGSPYTTLRSSRPPATV